MEAPLLLNFFFASGRACCARRRARKLRSGPGAWLPEAGLPEVSMSPSFLVGNERTRALHIPFKGFERVPHSLIPY